MDFSDKFMIHRNMNQFLALCAIAMMSVGIPVAIASGHKLNMNSDHHWLEFKRNFNKSYASSKQEHLRRQIFLDNKRFIDEFNANGNKSFKLGLNDMADWTEEEYARLNGLKVNKTHVESMRATPDALAQFIGRLANSSASFSESIDWRDHGRVTAVKNQGTCGSCWAFSTTGALEGYQLKQGLSQTLPLSEKYLVDCSRGRGSNKGCQGGSMDLAMLDVRDLGGIPQEADYPYEDRQGDCDLSKPNAFNVQNVMLLPEGDEKELQSVVGLHGPVAVGIYARTRAFQFYKSGVLDVEDCPKDATHAVVIVGYGRDPVGGEYWLVKNSWGRNWGDQGYIKMARNKDSQCGIADFSVVPMYF